MNILITCEGVRTEPNYFQTLIGELALNNVFTSIMGKGESTTKLIRDTICLRDAYAQDEEHPLIFDEVWTVFDRNDNEDFNKALYLAMESGIQCAWSNESIELWFLLHFVNTYNGRNRYIHKPNTAIHKPYSLRTTSPLSDEISKELKKCGMKCRIDHHLLLPPGCLPHKRPWGKM